ncbi:MAG: 50S ribosomal protein L18 [Desulfobacterales bacterium]|jgi:large subunit ribosomal protein L18|nr:50S ribosomal protein L18 [Desulfobacterales bacterium]
MKTANKKELSHNKRKLRVRKKVFGTASRPRLSVFRSIKHIYAQIIDDTTGNTLAASASTEKTILGDDSLTGKSNVAKAVGMLVARRAKEKGIAKVVFDRNGFLYHGRVKAVSDGAREAGLDF